MSDAREASAGPGYGEDPPSGRRSEPDQHVSEQPPRHLSLRTLAVHPLRRSVSLVVPLLVVVFGGGAFSFERFVVVPLAVVVLLVISLLHWATFTYRVGTDRVDIVHGLLGRRTRSIPLERVRGIDVTASPLHRLLGIAVVRIEAAAGGEGKAEGVLDAVTVAEAERLRVLLMRRADAPVEVRTDASAQSVVSPPLARVRPLWYLYAPLTGAYVLAPLALLGSLAGLLNEVSGDLGMAPQESIRRVVDSGLATPYGLVLLAVALLAAAPVVSVVGFALLNWDFTLRARDGSLVCERGLLTRRSVSLERGRIRGWELREGLLERVAGVARLRAVMTGLGNAGHRALLLPVAPRTEALATAARAAGAFRAPLRRHPPAARTRRLVRATVPWLLAALVAAWTAPAWLALAFLALAGLGVPLGLDRYRSLGHAADGDRIAVRAGSLTRRQAVIERRAVVGWTIGQTWFQRRVGLVTLVAGVGAGAGGYPAIDVAEDDAVRFACEVTPSWVTPLLERDPPDAAAGAGSTDAS